MAREWTLLLATQPRSLCCSSFRFRVESLRLSFEEGESRPFLSSNGLTGLGRRICIQEGEAPLLFQGRGKGAWEMPVGGRAGCVWVMALPPLSVCLCQGFGVGEWTPH